MSAFDINLSDALDAVDKARVADFVRYVNRRMDEDQLLAKLPFRTGFNVMLGGYVELAARDEEANPF